MLKPKKNATITKKEYRLLIKMWIAYCSDNKNDSALRVEMLFRQYKVEKFLNDLDKVLAYNLSEEDVSLIEMLLTDLETLAYEATKELTEEEYKKETCEFMFNNIKYYIFKSDVELVNKLICKLKIKL